MKTKHVLKPLIGLGLATAISSTVTADTQPGSDFTAIEGGVSRSLSIALQYLIETEAPENVDQAPDALVVKDEQGDPAILCSTTKPTCLFSNKLHSHANSPKAVDATIFRALYKASQKMHKDQKFVKIQNLAISGNVNRTSLTLEDPIFSNYQVAQSIQCGAHPSRSIEGSFDYPKCDYDIGVAHSGPEAQKVYEALKKIQS